MTEEKEVETVTANNDKENGEKINSEEENELHSSIIRQVEYYFGDLNLPRDKFLLDQISLDDGWVPLDILIKFNRLGKLTKDTAVIANALTKSTSGLLEISPDNKNVRRNPELPVPELDEDRRKELIARTLYAKGFPKESSLDDLLKYFKQYTDIENIIMRRYQDRQTLQKYFKGSIFLTFKSKESAEQFMNTKMKYDDTELIVMWQDDYFKMKREEHTLRRESKVKKNQVKEEPKGEKEELKLPPGTVLHFTQENKKMSRENIRDALNALGAEIAFISYQIGETEGWVRLTKENAAKELWEKMSEGKVKILETDVVFNLLEGDEEKVFLENTVIEMSNRRKNMKNFKYNKGKNSRGKQNRKRRTDQQHEDAPAPKVKADET